MNKLGGFFNRVPLGVKAAVGVGAVSGTCFVVGNYTGLAIQITSGLTFE